MQKLCSIFPLLHQTWNPEKVFYLLKCKRPLYAWGPCINNPPLWHCRFFGGSWDKKYTQQTLHENIFWGQWNKKKKNKATLLQQDLGKKNLRWHIKSENWDVNMASESGVWSWEGGAALLYLFTAQRCASPLVCGDPRCCRLSARSAWPSRWFTTAPFSR